MLRSQVRGRLCPGELFKLNFRLAITEHCELDKMTKRPPIPAELERNILIEAGHRCAIPTCRHIQVEMHHIVPWSKCKCHEYENLIALCPNCHARADRGEIDRKSLKMYKNKLRFLHDKFSRLEVDFLFELAEKGEVGVQLPDFISFLVKRILDAGYCLRKKRPSHVTIGSMPINPDLFTITDKGKEFLSDIQNPDHDI